MVCVSDTGQAAERRPIEKKQVAENSLKFARVLRAVPHFRYTLCQVVIFQDKPASKLLPDYYIFAIK